MIPLSLRQFASAVGATPKWVLNAATRMGKPVAYTDDDAQWVRLARTLNHDLRIPLRTAALLATQALKPAMAPATPTRPGTARHEPASQEVACIVEVQAEGVRLTIDLVRHRATFAAALAATVVFETPRRSGRKRPAPRNYGAAIGRARRHGIAIGMLRAKLRRPATGRVVRPAARVEPATGSANAAGAPGAPDVAALLTCLEARGVRAVVAGEVAEAVWGCESPIGPDPTPVQEPLELCYDGTSANLERLAAALRELDARPRTDGGSAVGAPIVDLITLRSSPAVALATRCGALDLRRELPGIGDFDQAVQNAAVVSVLGIAVPILELPALRRVRCAMGSRRDIERVLLLDAVLALPTLEARHREMALRRARWTAA